MINNIIMDIQQLYHLYQQHPIITTDSRDCPKDSIFFALKGESFDGNKFAAAAIEKGCAYAIIDNPEYQQDNRFILVEDVLQTFKDLAREHRRQFNIPVIGITGTNGKTTTKELIAAVLSEKYNTLYTQGNFNNDVGVPKTLFRLAPEHEIAVVEMGASHPGDIQTLVETAEPTCGLITNVGKAHLQGFGSFEGVMRTKGELYDYLKAHNALTFINGDNENLLRMAHDRDIDRAIEYGTSEGCQVEGNVISCAPFLKFQWNTRQSPGTPIFQEIQTHLIGAYNIDNMLAAITIGLHFGISPEQIHHALSNYIPTNNRSQMEETGKNHLIVDAYNANPSSMKAALDNFHLMQVSPKMAILGDMKELGATSHEEHQHIIDLMKEQGMENVWLVGDEFGNTQSQYRSFKNVEEVKCAIANEHIEGYYILIKGSNSIKLYQLPPLL